MMAFACSVIIPAYRRVRSLRECLASLERQTASPSSFEVIVVDDGSPVEIAPQIDVRDFPFRLQIVRTDHGGPGHARNIGMAAATAPIIVLLEDDVQPQESFLRNIVAAFDDASVDVVEGTTIIAGSSAPVRQFEAEDFLSFIPCNLALRKAVIGRIGGYSEEFFDAHNGLYFREDAEYGFRMLAAGLRVIKRADVIVAHPAQFANVAEAWRHVRRYQFDPLLYRKHPRMYRKHIEIKRMGGIRMRRPLHLLSASGWIGWMFVALGLCGESYAVLFCGIGLVLFSALALRFKYQGRRVLRVCDIAALAGFALVPWIYLVTLTRGCLKYRSAGCFIP